ncbi:hypothetical protein Gogos_005237, partial [Gossypium gossypioides]|nr:hypothetical protein [Gossypium gossypioides]
MEMKMEKLHIEVPPSPFHALSQFTIGRCNELKDATWLVLVPNLRFLWTNKCRKMEEILSEVADVVGIPYSQPFLNANQITIWGESDWWETVEWENETTRDVFFPSFRP